MVIVISPAKSLNLTQSNGHVHSSPVYQTEANKLVKVLRTYSKTDLQDLMGISETLAQENVSRFKEFKMRNPEKNAKRAIDLFAGDVYRGLDVADFSDEDYEFAQSHLRILSGLYGVLRPADLIQPYRLEMGTRFPNPGGKNLYEFWGNNITKQINKALQESGDDLLVNLASNEYFKSVKKAKLKGRILTINFKEYHEGTLKFLSFNAKVARGQMARYIIKNKFSQLEDIRGFNSEGYYFSSDHSSESDWLFVR